MYEFGDRCGERECGPNGRNTRIRRKSLHKGSISRKYLLV
jgi:hypothetical protein